MMMDNNLTQPEIQNEDVSQNYIQTDLPSQPQNKKSNTLILMLVGVIGFILVGLGGYYLGTMSSKITLEEVVDSVSQNNSGEVECTEDARLCSDGSSVVRVAPDCEFEVCPKEHNLVEETWQKYTSKDWGFSIQIPQNWRTQEIGDGIGFGPKEVMEDTLIGITVYDLNEKEEKEIIDQFGSQFEDKKQVRNIISVNGLVATEVITTTPSIEDWYYRAILIENNDLLYVISNGAILDEDIQGFRGVPQDYTFEKFLQSFQLKN